ncbi:hypothetical protein [Geoalkalibacter halelectricus]|uniref:hypothetical protein n=1 Tax=Geoalkalibacter halelectricus TaxID=2847045 RepID=UPI003D1BE2C1
MTDQRSPRDFEQLKLWIVAQAEKHRACQDDEDFWLAESIEMKVLRGLFDYAVATGMRVPPYDLGKILDAEDDEDPNVPSEGRWEFLLDLWERIRDPKAMGTLQIPAPVKELFQFFEDNFWPDTDDDT